MKHTSGPWQVTPDEIRVKTSEDVYDYQIADCEDTYLSPPIEQCKANARLIAAAPDLLEACKKALNIPPDYHLPCNVVEALSQAIAKAEGKL